MDLNMDQECGEVRKEIPIKENGNSENLMAMEFIPGPMEIHIKDSSNNASNMAKASNDSQTGTCIKAIMSTENRQDMDNIFGSMVVFSRVISAMV